VKPTIKLSRRIAVTPWHIQAKVALAAQREWEPAVLRMIADERSVSAERLATDLLAGRTAVAKRLLRTCEALGLAHEVGRGAFELTEDGARAAQTGEILIPEDGTWTLWHSPERMLPSPVVALEAYQDPATLDDVQRAKSKQPMRKFVRLTDAVRDLRGQTVAILHGDHRRVRFDELMPQGEEASDAYPTLTLELELTERQATARVRGTLNRTPIDLGLPQTGPTYQEAWIALLAGAGLVDLWDEPEGVLRVAFAETSVDERKTFSRDLTIKRPTIGAWGAFDDTVIKGVQLAPATPADAEAWATWRLRQAVQSTATRERFAEWSRTAAEPFGALVPNTPDRATLAALLRGEGRPTPTYWRLQAAEDWNL
jgi:hypothetical protein